VVHDEIATPQEEMIQMGKISGLVLGLALILPIGPQNLFVLNQELFSKRRYYGSD
jgi:arginine exporter protein ArgO